MFYLSKKFQNYTITKFTPYWVMVAMTNKNIVNKEYLMLKKSAEASLNKKYRFKLEEAGKNNIYMLKMNSGKIS